MTVKWTAWGGLRETRKGGDAAPPRDVTDIHVCDVVRRWWSWFSSPSERNCASAHDQRQVRVCDRSNDVVHKEQWNGDMFYSFWVFTSLFDLSWTLCFWRRKVPRIHTVLHLSRVSLWKLCPEWCRNIPARFRTWLAETLCHSAFVGWAAEYFGRDSQNLAGMLLHNSLVALLVYKHCYMFTHTFC